MARDSSAGAKPPRRASVAPEPNRSSLRRVSNRRIATRPAPAARKDPPSAFGEPAAAPRNRRVARPEPPRPARPLRSRGLGLVLFAKASASLRAFVEALRALWERLVGPVTSTLRVLGVLAFLGGAVLLARFLQQHLTTAAAFAIDRVDVTGLARLERGELLEAAGLELGVNVFATSPDEVRARLLRHPWIISAQVQRKLPSRFEIAVREREPVALLVIEGCGAAPAVSADELGESACGEPSSLYLVSDEGKMFKRLGGKDPVDLPVITGVTRARFASDPEFSRRVLVDAIALLHEYRNSGLWQRFALGEIHVEANDGLSLYVGEDLTYVRLGAPPFTQKLRRMKRVFERLEREHARAEYVYLDNEQRPDRVAVRLR